VHILPFHGIAEAKENASALQKAFQFYSLLSVSGEDCLPSTLGLQRTQEIMARALGCTGWRDLTRTVSLGRPAAYFDSEDTAELRHTELAAKFLPFLEHEDKDRRIYAALSFSAFGCTPSARKEAISIMKLMPCGTVEQWHQLQMLESGYRHATRYNHGWPAEEAAMFHWQYEKRKATILGISAPPKPRISKGRRKAF